MQAKHDFQPPFGFRVITSKDRRSLELFEQYLNLQKRIRLLLERLGISEEEFIRLTNVQD